jgi:hypothetical protein
VVGPGRGEGDDLADIRVTTLERLLAGDNRKECCERWWLLGGLIEVAELQVKLADMVELDALQVTSQHNWCYRRLDMADRTLEWLSWKSSMGQS